MPKPRTPSGEKNLISKHLIELREKRGLSQRDLGVKWFKDNGKWQDRGYTPTPGTIIFFDWQENGRRDGESDLMLILMISLTGKIVKYKSLR